MVVNVKTKEIKFDIFVDADQATHDNIFDVSGLNLEEGDMVMARLSIFDRQQNENGKFFTVSGPMIKEESLKLKFIRCNGVVDVFALVNQ
jgi:hypothetical protein